MRTAAARARAFLCWVEGAGQKSQSVTIGRLCGHDFLIDSIHWTRACRKSTGEALFSAPWGSALSAGRSEPERLTMLICLSVCDHAEAGASGARDERRGSRLCIDRGRGQAANTRTPAPPDELERDLWEVRRSKGT
jgi:hypothetical protein